MAKPTKKSTTKRQPSRSPPGSGVAKRGRTNNSASVPLGSGQSASTTQPRSRRATVQTEEEDEASHGEDIEVEVGASEPDIPKESSPESGNEASEDELGQ
jgi:hypothetical protein